MSNTSKKSIFWNTLGSMMFSLNTILMLMSVSRILGVTSAGEFGIALTTSQILYIIGVYGMNNYQMTDYAKKYRFSEYLTAKLLTSILMIIACALFLILFPTSITKTKLTILLTTFMLINSIAEVFQSLFFQENRLDLSGKSLFIRTFISFVTFTLFLYSTQNVFVSLVIMTLSNLLVMFFTTIQPSKRYAEIKLSLDYRNIISLIKECTPVFLSVFLMTFMINCSKYAIEIYLNDTLQGHYNIIFMPALAINLFSSFIFKPMLSEFSQFISNDDIKQLFTMIKRILKFIFLLTIICCIGAFFIGTQILGALYKTDLSLLRWELTLIIIGGGLLAISILFYYLIIILRRQNLILLNYVLSSIFATGISFILVKKLDIMGAVISFVLAHFVLVCIFVLMFLFLVKGIQNAQNNNSTNNI